MRKLFPLLWLWVSLVTAATLPTEIKLTNGAVLHGCKAVRWNRDSVVIKHVGGADPIRFSYISPEQLGAVLAARPTEEDAVQAATRTISGVAFVTSQNLDVHKLGGLAIFVYQAIDIEEARAHVAGYLRLGFTQMGGFPRQEELNKAWVESLKGHKPLTYTTTDEDGKYHLELPVDGDFFVFASIPRMMGFYSQYYSWVVPIGKGETLDLNNLNTGGELVYQN